MEISTLSFWLRNVLLKKLNVNIECSKDSLENIPDKGAFVATSNFPHGLLDFFILTTKIIQKRPDTKFLVDPALDATNILN